MKNSILRGALLATTMTSLVIPSFASAQLAPTTRAVAIPTAASSVAMQSNVAAVTRDNLTGGLRAVRPGDNDRGVMNMEDFVRQYPKQGEAGFRRIQDENAEVCSETGSIVREALAISAEANEIDGQLSELDPILVKLGREQNSASLLSMGAAVVSTGFLCALSGGLYCAAAGASGLGSIFQSKAHRQTLKVDRKMRVINVRQSRLQIRATLLTMRANILWANAMQGYCLKVYPAQTLGSSN